MGSFEPPDLDVNEDALAVRLAADILPENLTPLVTANFLLALDAHGRKLTRQYFEDVLVMAFNFQNRLVRLAELTAMARTILEGKDPMAEIQADITKHMAVAKTHQHNLLQVLKMFGEMRGPQDPVS